MAKLQATYFVVDNQAWSIQDRAYVLKAIFGSRCNVIFSEASKMMKPERECRTVVLVPHNTLAWQDDELPREGALEKFDVAILYRQDAGAPPVNYATDCGTQIADKVPDDRSQVERARDYARAYAEKYGSDADDMTAIYRSHLAELMKEARREPARME